MSPFEVNRVMIVSFVVLFEAAAFRVKFQSLFRELNGVFAVIKERSSFICRNYAKYGSQGVAKKVCSEKSAGPENLKADYPQRRN